MILPENHDTRKSTGNQEPTDKRTTDLLAVLDKFRPRRKPIEHEVRLKHEFLMAWAPILTPSAFKVYVMLERFAVFTPGPLLHHTNGWMSLRELAIACGMKRATVNRAIRDLARHRLVTLTEADPGARQRGGRRIDLEVDNTARPTPGTSTLLGAKLPAPAEDVGGQTYPPEGIRSYPPEGIRSYPPEGTRTFPPKGQGTYPPEGIGSSGSMIVARVDTSVPSSSSSSLSTGKTDDDERREKPTELTPIREQLPYIVDDAWLNELWAEARATAPDISVPELTRVIACKVKVLNGKTISNPVAYLKTAVLRAIAGEGLGEYRAWFAIAAAASGGKWPV